MPLTGFILVCSLTHDLHSPFPIPVGLEDYLSFLIPGRRKRRLMGEGRKEGPGKGRKVSHACHLPHSPVSPHAYLLFKSLSIDDALWIPKFICHC